jgi:hypothetical protein
MGPKPQYLLVGSVLSVGANENGPDALFLGLMAETWISSLCSLHQVIVKSGREASVSVSRMGCVSVSLSVLNKAPTFLSP